jgi:hypothetical protein
MYSSTILHFGTSWRWVISFTSWPLYPQGNSPQTHWMGGWMGPWICLDAVEDRKILHFRESKPGRPARSPPLYRLSYPDSSLNFVYIYSSGFEYPHSKYNVITSIKEYKIWGLRSSWKQEFLHESDDSWRQRGYCCQIYVSTELGLPASRAAFCRHTVTTISRNIIKIIHMCVYVNRAMKSNKGV